MEKGSANVRHWIEVDEELMAQVMSIGAFATTHEAIRKTLELTVWRSKVEKAMRSVDRGKTKAEKRKRQAKWTRLFVVIPFRKCSPSDDYLSRPLRE
jgi:Arc/MetJ family transcription regulator